MPHSQNANSLLGGIDAIENAVVAYNHVPCIFITTRFIFRKPKRHRFEKIDTSLNLLNDSLGGGGIVRSDVVLDFA